MRMFLARSFSLLRSNPLVALAIAIACAAFCSSSALAGPPTMDAVTFPVDVASIGTALAVAGATVLLIWFSTGIGFKLARKLYHRVTGTL